MPQRGKHHGAEPVEVDCGHSEIEGGKHGHHHNNNNNNYAYVHKDYTGDSKDPNITKCCVPTNCNLNQPIRMEDLNDCVKVICNNENCNQGRYMHKSCFESFEATVMTYLRSTGRARSWSEKQRLQNLWTKKGYDLAYKACGCKCGKGHLRKDLDWTAPVATSPDETGKKKKNRKKKANDKPSLIISTSMSISNGSNKHHVSISTGNNNSSSNNMASGGGVNSSSPSNGSALPISRLRTSSMSSTGSGVSGASGGTSPPVSGSESLSPGFLDQSAFMKKFFGAGEQQHGSFAAPFPHHQQSHPHHSHFHDSGRRERRGSGSIFCRRQDYSSFNNLPKHKINSYHIKMEDDHGNDETRNFILSTLSANRMNRVSCIMCHTSMMIFDKYPLIDGTFFLSPTQHSKGAVLTTIEGKNQYLNAVCMSCLEGWNSTLKCRSCSTCWTGSHLILGSMYSYDIFAAVPCCTDRLRCNNCKNLVISPDQRLQFFSHYSNAIACGHCGTVDFHFAKPLQIIYNRTGRE